MNIFSRTEDEMGCAFMASPLDYRDVSVSSSTEEAGGEDGTTPTNEGVTVAAGPTQAEVDVLLIKARVQAIEETEAKMQRELERSLEQERALLLRVLGEFAESRKDYFATVEGEVIQLALAIAAKILHRESSADPTLVAAMVRIGLDKLQSASQVILRVPEGSVDTWVSAMSDLPRGIQAEVVGDAHLVPGDCVLQAEAGSVDLGVGAQLKNIEQSFLDLLQKRPVK